MANSHERTDPLVELVELVDDLRTQLTALEEKVAAVAFRPIAARHATIRPIGRPQLALVSVDPMPEFSLHARAITQLAEPGLDAPVKLIDRDPVWSPETSPVGG